MADYKPLITRALATLDPNTEEARAAIYERARNALVKQLRGLNPPLSEAEITRHRLDLEEAIRKVEAEQKAAARMVAPPPPAEAPRPEAPRLDAPRPDLSRAEALRTSAPRIEAPEPDPVPPVSPLARRPSDQPGDAPPPEAPRLRPPAPPGAEENVRAEAALPGPPRDLIIRRSEDPRRTALRPPVEDEPLPDDDGGAPTQPVVRRPAGEPGEPPRLRPRIAAQSEPAAPAKRGKSGALLWGGLALALLLLAGAGVYFQRETLFGAGPRAPVVQAPPSGTPATDPAAPKAGDRVGGEEAPVPPRVGGDPAPAGQPPRVAVVAQRAVLIEEDPEQPQTGRRSEGTIVWRTETVSPGPGLPPALAIRADIEVPERRMQVTISLRRNFDQTLPASHTVEILFTLPLDFEPGGIRNVPGIMFKPQEQRQGVPLAGLGVKVTDGFFLLGLSSADNDVQRNLLLMRERSWIDLPILYNNGRRAILTLEKGLPGEKVFEDALASWAQ